MRIDDDDNIETLKDIANLLGLLTRAVSVHVDNKKRIELIEALETVENDIENLGP